MEQNQNQTSISLGDLWNIFTDHALLIISAAIITFIAVSFYSIVTFTPTYQSSSMLYIVRQNSTESGGTTAQNSDFTLALSTVNDCKILLTSNSVLEQVIDELGMPISKETLRSMITIQNPTSTRILVVSITAPTPMDAKLIVEKLCEVGAVSIMETMGINQINPVDKDENGNYLGTYNERPANSKFTPLSLVAAMLAAGLIFGVYVLLFVLDDKIKTPDDIERYTGLTLLGMIPNIEEDKGPRYGKGAYYGLPGSSGRYSPGK